MTNRNFLIAHSPAETVFTPHSTPLQRSPQRNTDALGDNT
jgi:hypothetical protein